MDPTTTPREPPLKPRAPADAFYRHRLPTRITHWLNAIVFILLLMSGLQIFNAHPRLYWGEAGAETDRPFIAMISERSTDGVVHGVTHIGPFSVRTTGVLGVSSTDGRVSVRGFPDWATLPSWQDLAAGRLWHFALAWVFVINGGAYLAFGFLSGHFRKDLRLTRDEVRPRNLLADVRHHLSFKAPRGEAARRYNPLQKIAYVSVIFVFLPLMLLTGLTMSPGFNAIAPILLDVFGGRQSARTLHFLSAAATVVFLIIHIAEVFIAGAWNEMRSMITGWYVVKAERTDDQS